jgi:hypothetical protein
VRELKSYECVGGPLDGDVLTPPSGNTHPVIVVRGHDNLCRPAYWPIRTGAVVGRYVLRVYGGGALRDAMWERLDSAS